MVVETSERRRDAVIGAMTSARDELVERAIMRKPSVWPLRIVGAAAAVLIAVALGWMLLQPDHTWRVVSVSGKAIRVEDQAALAPGDVLKPGDEVSVLDGSAVLESSMGRIELAPLTSVALRSRSRVQVRGTLRAESRQELTVTNHLGDRAVVRQGAATIASDLRAVSPVRPDVAPEPTKYEGDRLRVQVEQGQAVMRGSRGELLLEAGQESRLDQHGTPAPKGIDDR
jgi:hypothetical protein